MATVELISRENNILRVTVAFDAAEVDKQYTQVYRELANSLKIAGFRKGKIPPNVIRQRVGAESLAEAVEDNLREKAADQAVHECKVFPRKGRVTWHEEPKPAEGQPLIYDFSIPVMPEIELPDFNAYEFTLPRLEVTDSMKQRFYDRMRDRLTEYPEKQVPAAAGDGVLLTMSSTFADSSEVAPLAQDMMLFVIGKEGNLPGWDERVIGATPGQEVEFAYTVPEDFDDPRIAGKQLNVKLQIKTVHEVIAPVIDDAYVKEHLKFESLEQYDEYVLRHLTMERDTVQARMMRDMVVQKLVDAVEPDISDDMVEESIDGLVEENEREAREHDSSLEDQLKQSGMEMPAYRDSLRQLAINKLKLTLIVRTIAEQQELRATVQDFERYAAYMVQREGITPKQFKELLGYPEFVSEISHQIMQEKVLDYLVSCAKFTTAMPGEQADSAAQPVDSSTIVELAEQDPAAPTEA
jgi:trigger factor